MSISTNAAIIDYFEKQMPPKEFAQQLRRAAHIIQYYAMRDNNGMFADWAAESSHYMVDFAEVIKPVLENEG